MSNLVMGLDTFGDVAVDDAGVPLSQAAAIRQVIDEAVLADDLGVDVIALGEHHRPEYSISSPETVLAAISRGRAEAILGRGLFTESFPLFGYDLSDYDVLFEEKLDLFVKLLDEKPVTWSGTVRAGLANAEVFPKTESGRLPTWVGVGGSPQSVVRTARHGLPMMLAIIGGTAGRFAPYVELYRR